MRMGMSFFNALKVMDFIRSKKTSHAQNIASFMYKPDVEHRGHLLKWNKKNKKNRYYNGNQL
jgi:hypothetical protein